MLKKIKFERVATSDIAVPLEINCARKRKRRVIPLFLISKQSEKSGITIVGCVIIAIGLIIAALIFSNTVADRPIQGNFSGSLSAGGYTYPDIMDIDGLKGYLGIHPTSNENTIENYEENYSEIDNTLRSDLQNSILDGDWPEFPYVQLDGKLYFSKQAVDEWFLERGKQQLRVE